MEPPPRFALFGSPAVEQGGLKQALPFERRTQLLVLLALRGGWVPRAEIAAMLWPEQDSKLAYANLRKTLFRLAPLGWANGLESQAGALRLGTDVDVAAFEQALREQRHDDALALYRGDLLDGFDDGQSEAWTRWLAFERDRLRAAWRAAALARLADANFDAAAALVLAARLLDADPLDEAALRARMAWLQRTGQTSAARQAYREFVERLQRDLGIEPGAELRAAHEGLAAPLAAPLEMAIADAGFIGRSIELQRIAALLARDECRLLCLIGPGGMGKTRLARRALHELASRFADGAAFVALEDIDTPAQFGLRMAQEAGVAPARGGTDALAGAIEVWRERRMLLVLDNFEQLAEQAALLERLLHGCAHLKLIVTSRVRLALAYEWSLPLEGLPCPDPEDQDHAESFDAVRLFTQAALRVDPAFAAAAEAAAIVDICRLVEGLPLALELAAAWVRVLPCAAIATELRQGGELLRARDAAHPARQASIEVVFEHSWQRLAPVEREALARLSVFHGGFTIEAARSVAGASLPVLGALADKSLLTRQGARMHLHPLVQQLSALRLGEGETRAATEAAHAAYFLLWLAQLEAAVEDGRREALQAIDTEFENCRRAWQIATRDGQAEALLASSRTVLDYIDDRGRAEDALAWLHQTIHSPLGRADAGLRATLVGQLAHLEYRMHRYDDARAHARQALADSRHARDGGARRQALTVLAGCALQQGRLADARGFYQRLLKQASIEGLDHSAAGTLDNLAIVQRRLGHYDEALSLSSQSLALHRRIGDLAGVALCLNTLAGTHMILHDYPAARAHLQEALAITQREGQVFTRTYVLGTLAEVALKSGDWAAAADHGARANELAERSGNRSVSCWMKLLLARVAVRRSELGAARAATAANTRLAVVLGSPSLYAVVLLVFAELLEAQGERAAARQVLAFAAAHPTITTSDRDDLRAEWAGRTSATVLDPPWPAITLDELLHRIVAEAEVAHGQLIAALRGAT